MAGFCGSFWCMRLTVWVYGNRDVRCKIAFYLVVMLRGVFKFRNSIANLAKAFKSESQELLHYRNDAFCLLLLMPNPSAIFKYIKSVNLQFNTVGRRDNNMIVPPSDGPMIIWIDWEWKSGNDAFCLMPNLSAGFKKYWNSEFVIRYSFFELEFHWNGQFLFKEFYCTYKYFLCTTSVTF